MLQCPRASLSRMCGQGQFFVLTFFVFCIFSTNSNNIAIVSFVIAFPAFSDIQSRVLLTSKSYVSFTYCACFFLICKQCFLACPQLLNFLCFITVVLLFMYCEVRVQQIVLLIKFPNNGLVYNLTPYFFVSHTPYNIIIFLCIHLRNCKVLSKEPSSHITTSQSLKV